jgi:hypothetical protein
MEWSMSRGRRRWRRCGRSMLKLAGLCLAVAVCLCLCLYLCGVRPWACSGCTVLLRSGKRTKDVLTTMQMLACRVSATLSCASLSGDLLCIVIGVSDAFLVHGSCLPRFIHVLVASSCCVLCSLYMRAAACTRLRLAPDWSSLHCIY